jgi:hypothetical protein
MSAGRLVGQEWTICPSPLGLRLMLEGHLQGLLFPFANRSLEMRTHSLSTFSLLPTTLTTRTEEPVDCRAEGQGGGAGLAKRVYPRC